MAFNFARALYEFAHVKIAKIPQLLAGWQPWNLHLTNNHCDVKAQCVALKEIDWHETGLKIHGYVFGEISHCK